MTTKLAVPAYVNYGRWVADCPFCPGAEQVYGELQHKDRIPYPYGIVDSTLHCGYTGKTAPVVFPAHAPQIISILRRRPRARNRNWYPHESVQDLIDENRAHGVG